MASLVAKWSRSLVTLSAAILLAPVVGAQAPATGQPAAAPAQPAQPATPAQPAAAPAEPAQPATPAQPAPEAAPPEAASPQPAAASKPEQAPREEAATDFKLAEEAQRLTPAQMLHQHEKAMVEMRDALKAALAVLSDARQKKDIVLINCVNERITQIKGVLRVAEEASTRLQEQAATSNIDGARVSFTQVMLARDRIVTLKVAAQNCVGAESYYGGQTEVLTDINPEIAGGDPFFGDRGTLDTPRDDFAEGSTTTVDNTSPETPVAPPLTSQFQP